MTIKSFLSPTVVLAAAAFAAQASAAVISQGAAVTLLAGPNGKPGEEITTIVDGNTSKYYGAGSVLPSIKLVPTLGSTIITELRIFTGNDTPGRDPSSFILWGSNDGGATYVQITSQTITLPAARNVSGNPIPEPPGSLNYGTATFSNTNAFTTYKFDVTSVNDLSVGGAGTQFAELQLIGNVIPEPTSALLSVIGSFGLLAVRRR